ncbi:MAG: SDR family NAD(P)-dependent oxidoreductase [Myxococcota bacterium]
MRVLVTGGTGFIGSHTVEALVRAGHQVRLLARDADKVRRVFGPRGLTMEDVVLGDVTDPSVVSKALDGCEGVVHAAALVALKKSEARKVLDTNQRAVELVVGGAHERGLGSIVYVSSLSALGRPGGDPITVDSPIGDAGSAYAASKADAERYAQDLLARGAPLRISYPPGVVGPDDPGMSGANYAVYSFLNVSMVDTSSGFCILDVRDLAEIHARLVDPDTPPGRYLIPGHFLSWPDTIAMMDRVTGRRVNRVRVPGALLRLAGRLGDAVKNVWDFDYPLTHESMAFASGWPGAEMSPALAALAPTFRDPRQTYEDTVRWMHRAGHLSAEQAGKLAEG